jgi:hypothetical protein
MKKIIKQYFGEDTFPPLQILLLLPPRYNYEMLQKYSPKNRQIAPKNTQLALYPPLLTAIIAPIERHIDMLLTHSIFRL